MFLIVGFTKRTSYCLAKYLAKGKHALVIVDKSNTFEQQTLLKELSQQTTIIDELGNQDVSLLSCYPIQKIFLSPGVPKKIPLIQEALRLGIEVLNDIEYFYQLFPYRKYIAITGTDGKTTVTTWLAHVLSSQYPTVMVGNIGTPIFEYADDIYKNYFFIVELSSFQLESTNTFKANIALITNIHEDHLDRYENMLDYALTKKRIFLNQSIFDLALINQDDDYSVSFVNEISAQKLFFSYTKKSDIYVQDENIYLHNVFFMRISQLSMVGVHNVQNALMVLAIADYLKVEKELIKSRLIDFQGVEHRLEFVAKINGITFYNDSKATTLQALSKALEAFDKKVILLAGGQSKGLKYQKLKPLIESKTKKAIVFGELSIELMSSWGSENCIAKSNLAMAVEKAINLACEGDIILLSPGAASFDEFKSYEHRGLAFKTLIEHYKHQEKL